MFMLCPLLGEILVKHHNLKRETNQTNNQHMDDHEDEIKEFIKAWLAATTSLCYSYYVSSKIPGGILRFLSLLPVFTLFTFLPLKLSSFTLGGPTYFFLTWLANFKILLFAFDLGPLSSPSTSLIHFVSIASLPIRVKVKQHDPSVKTASRSNFVSDPVSETSKNIKFAFKFVLLCILLSSCEHKKYMHPYMVLVLYCLILYVSLDVVLAISASPVRAILGLEIEPQFNEPYLATSLQDFWGRRWNLMVTSILRPTVYDPSLCIFKRVLPSNTKWIKLPPLLATFLVSGLMHELVYYHITRASPTWEVTLFFVLHGVCTSIEIIVKKAVGSKWKLHRAVSSLLTIAFMMVTGAWLFFPQLLRNGVDDKAIGEYEAVKDFVRHTLMPKFKAV